MSQDPLPSTGTACMTHTLLIGALYKPVLRRKIRNKESCVTVLVINQLNAQNLVLQ